MIIVDYNNIAIAPVVMNKMRTADLDQMRHIILNTIRNYRKFNTAKFGEIVIVTDGGGNWRKNVFPHYKARRATDRDEDKVDWPQVFGVLEQVFNEIGENFPYRTFRQRGCEADDVIAQLVKETQGFGQYEPVLIVSSDKDYGQLHKYDNVKQISPRLKKMLEIPNPRLHLEMLILDGDRIDGIPNVLSADDTFVSGGRQTPLREVAITKLLADPQSMGEQIYRNYQRNKKLIDFDEMPAGVASEILNTIRSNGDKAANKRKVMPYLMNHQCEQLLENIEDFVR